MKIVNVLSPVRFAPAPLRTLAPRRPTLRGCRVGILDNSKPNADVLLGRIADLLVTKHGAGSIARWHKPGASRAATVHDEIAAAVDVLLTGSAD
jgi:hypothetical protein